MAEETPLEKTAKTAPQQKAEEKKLIGTLESVVDETSSFVKNAAITAAGIATPYMFSGENRLNAKINAWPLQGGTMMEDLMKKQPINYTRAAKEGLVGTIMAPPLAGLFKGIELGRSAAASYGGPLVGGAAAIGGLAVAQAAFVGAYMGLNHIVQNHTFKGLYEKFKKDYWPGMKNIWKYVLPVSSLNVLYLYQFGIPIQLAYSSLMTLFMRLALPSEGASVSNLVSEMKDYGKTVFSSGGKLARNTFKGFYDAVYAVGNSFTNLVYKSTPTPSPAPTPATAPAH